MKVKNVRSVCILISCVMISLFIAIQCAAQTQSQTGLPPWTPFDSDAFSNVNLASLNIHIEVPLRSLPGRLLPLNAHLDTDTNTLGTPAPLYGPGSAVGWPGTRTQLVPVWTPRMGNFVADGLGPGIVLFTTTQSPVYRWSNVNYGSYSIFSNFSYIDNHGTLHTFPQNLQAATVAQPSGLQCTNFYPNPGWGTNMPAGLASDGSSYYLFLTGGNGAPGAYVLDAHDIKNDSIDLNGNLNQLNNDQKLSRLHSPGACRQLREHSPEYR